MIEKHEKARIKQLNDQKHLLSVQIVWMIFMKILMSIIQQEKRNLIVFDDSIRDIMNNKKFHTIMKEFFVRCRKLNISLVFISLFYFSVPKDVRLN